MALERRSFLGGMFGAMVAPFLPKPGAKPQGHCGYCYDGEPAEVNPGDPESLACNEPHHLVWDSTRKVWTHPDDGCPDYDDSRFFDNPHPHKPSVFVDGKWHEITDWEPQGDRSECWKPVVVGSGMLCDFSSVGSFACSGALPGPLDYGVHMCECEEPLRNYFSLPGIYAWSCDRCGGNGRRDLI